MNFQSRTLLHWINHEYPLTTKNISYLFWKYLKLEKGETSFYINSSKVWKLIAPVFLDIEVSELLLHVKVSYFCEQSCFKSELRKI